MIGNATSPSRRFGPGGRFELQPLERQLLVDGEPAALGARAFDLLLALAAEPGRLQAKHQLLEAVWPGVVVEEGNLATQVGALRKVLGGDVIVTVPGRGYRFATHIGPAPAARHAAAVSATDDPGLPAAGSAPAPQARLKTNLPQPLHTLLGRSDDLAALAALVDRHPLTSIVGAGGMGKSLLAQHLLEGRRSGYTHGVCWVELGAVTDRALLPGTVAAALGVPLGGSDALAGLCSALAPLQLLVALDNAEQVQDGVAALVQAMLQAAPGVRVVVTSQAPLRLQQEQVFRIGPLAVPEGPLPAAQAMGFGAVALFAERARSADSRFELTDASAPAAIALCRALDGLPLAIELAAARVPVLGVQRLAASMQDRLRLLTSSRNRLAPERQQTLRATLEWSHGFLDERERAVFRRLAVFTGSGSLDMIQQVVADPPGAGAGSEGLDGWAVLDALMLLVDRSLVTVLDGDGATEPRYRLLDSPRAFALELLDASGEEAVLRLRHVAAVAAQCDLALQAYYGGQIGRDVWARNFAQDVENARAAMAQAIAAGERTAALRIGVTRMRAAQNLPTSERLEILEQCIAQLDDSIPPALQLQTWISVSNAAGEYRPLLRREAAQRALQLVKQRTELQSDRFQCFNTWCLVANSAVRGSGHDPEVRDALEQARALEDPGWPAHKRLWRAMAELWAAAPESPDAVRVAREALALDLASGGNGHAVRSNIIDAELVVGDARAAVQTGEALLIALEGGRSEQSLAYTRLNLAAARLALDDAPGARSLAQAGWPQTGLFDLQVFWADYLALLAALEARPRAAARLSGYGDAGYAARDETREPNEANAHLRACALARAALGDAEFDRLHAEGRTLRGEQIEAIAFATQDAACLQPLAPNLHFNT